MLEIQKLRSQTDNIVAALDKKGVQDAASTVQQILDIDEQRRATITELEQLRKQMNDASKSIGKLMQAGQREEAEAAKKTTSAAKEKIKELETALTESEQAQNDLVVQLPNTPHESVPAGRNADDNVVVSEHKVDTSFDFKPLPHWDLARKHDLIDWELGSKITGAGFPVYKGKGARLQRALIAFFLDQAHQMGYTEYMPPLVVNEASGFGTGQLPDKEGQMYHIERDNLYLIPTAEVPITNLFRNVVVQAAELPVKACGYTPCFRREAGSYGKDVKGLNRLHQFDKVEIVQVVHPEKSYDVLEEMTSYVESLLVKLELPFRRLLLCTGDMSFTSAKTFDMEVFSAGQDRWLEVSSISNFETYQTNRLKLRFKDGKKNQLAHSLNGSALALPRIVAAMLENHQQADGSIRIPEALVPYTSFDQIG
ncbi:serine--tRNA ligase [Pontibacter sp. G13]|uniref:serine--tRNA ligase n=1 Tax=Pontibacter sp. G13 TaxID=3074898 RepID=UPI00288AC975|nr:serine--tRNA ligase [Pontibacter sp. G13]WNJ16261.1 serine--tRNA ligase [Pontibacter sp. G13]